MKTYPPLVLLFALLQGAANLALADAAVQSLIRYEAAAASHPIILSWPAIPGSGYLIQAVPELGSPWQTLTSSPLWASTNVMNWSEAADPCLRQRSRPRMHDGSCAFGALSPQLFHYGLARATRGMICLDGSHDRNP